MVFDFSRRLFAILIVGMPLLSFAAKTADEPLSRALDYINTPDFNCAYDHAYQCTKIDEMTLKMDQSRLVPAVYLKAWPIAYADFLSLNELSDAQKQLKHYKIGFAEAGDKFVVIFTALLLPSINKAGEVEGLMNVSFGASMRYLIDKQSLAIVSRKRYR